MKYRFTERVETGYSHPNCIGGTLYITLTFKKFVDKTRYSQIIDTLDHCDIIEDIDAEQFNKRFYRLEYLDNIFRDVVSILTSRFNNERLVLPKTITVKFLNDEFETKPKVYNSIENYQIED